MKTILLVDDSRAVRLVGRRMMGTLGLEVLEAEDGKQALEVARANPELDAVCWTGICRSWMACNS